MRKVKEKVEVGSNHDGPVRVTDANFLGIVRRNSAVLIDFCAEGCGPCRALAPRVEELATKYDGKLFVGKLDIEKNPETADLFGVRCIPTLALFKDGKEVDKIIGCVSKRTLEKTVKEAFNFDGCGW